MIGPLFFSQILAVSLSRDIFLGAGYFIAAMLLVTSLVIGLNAVRRGAV